MFSHVYFTIYFLCQKAHTHIPLFCCGFSWLQLGSGQKSYKHEEVVESRNGSGVQ